MSLDIQHNPQPRTITKQQTTVYQAAISGESNLLIHYGAENPRPFYTNGQKSFGEAIQIKPLE